MGDWPVPLIDTFAGTAILSSLNDGSIAGDAARAQGATFKTSNAWQGSNLALFMPIMVRQAQTIRAFGWFNGASVSGNCDAGLYDNNGNRLSSLGSTAQSGTSQSQSASVTAFTIDPGLYYLAMAMDNGTGTVLGSSLTGNGNPQLMRVSGMAQMTSAFPLPSTATFAAATRYAVTVVAVTNPSGVL